MGEVFTLYFSQRIASTELDRTREPIPVRLLTHGGPSQRLHCGCLVAAQLVSDIALSQSPRWLRPTEFLATLPALAVAAKAGKSAQRGSSSPYGSPELRDDF